MILHEKSNQPCHQGNWYSLLWTPRRGLVFNFPLNSSLKFVKCRQQVHLPSIKISYFPLVEFMHESTVLVELFWQLPINRDVLCTFKQRDQNMLYNTQVYCSTFVHLNFRAHFQERFMYESQGLPVYIWHHSAICIIHPIPQHHYLNIINITHLTTVSWSRHQSHYISNTTVSLLQNHSHHTYDTRVSFP